MTGTGNAKAVVPLIVKAATDCELIRHMPFSPASLPYYFLPFFTVQADPEVLGVPENGVLAKYISTMVPFVATVSEKKSTTPIQK